MTRYARQMLLPEVGPTGQARLAGAHVAVIGAGGLGCPVIQYLAGAGVGRITLVDPDRIEESNLHRQTLYRMADLGHPKAEVARDYVRAFNPAVTVQAHVTALGPASAAALLPACDLVIDAADSFAVTYILSDTCLLLGKPLISASVLGQTGYVGGFCASVPSLRAVFPDLPLSGASCATAGVLGPVVGVIGALQAQIALRVLLGATPSPLGQMITADLVDMRFGSFSFRATPEPEQGFSFIGSGMLRDSDLIVELRNPVEAPEKITASALRITSDALTSLVPAPDQRVVLCCSTGLRAWRAADELRARGVTNLALLAATACT